MNRPISSRRFLGTILQLQEIVAMTNLDGKWAPIPHGWSYRCQSGALLNWWPTTGTINFQGSHGVAAEFEAALIEVIRGGGSPPPLLQGSDK